MEYSVIKEVLYRLVGNINPVGESYTDSEALENLGIMVKVLDDVLSNIYEIYYHNYGRSEGSMNRCGKAAKDFLEHVNETYNTK